MSVTVKELLVKLDAKVTGLETGLKKANTKLKTTQTASDNLKGAVGKLGKAFVGLAAVAGAGALFKGMISSAAEFEKTLANVSTLVDTSAVNMGEYETAILDMAGELGSATDLTQGLYQALSAGIEPGKAIEFVGEAAKFAKAALTDTYSAVDVLTTALNAYGLEATEAGRVSDILFQTVKDGKVTGQELAATLGNVIPTAVALGVNLETVSAAVATMTKHGIKAAEATTFLKNVFNTILNPAKEAADVAKSIGIEMSKAGVEGAGGFQQWLMKLKVAVGDNTELMTKMFPNIRALQAAFVLAGKGADDFNTVLGNMETALGNTDEAFKKQQETFSATMEALGNKIEAVIVKLVLPTLQSLADWLNDHMNDIELYISAAVEALETLGQVAEALSGAGEKAQESMVGTVESQVDLMKKRVLDFAKYLKTNMEDASGHVGLIRKALLDVEKEFEAAEQVAIKTEMGKHVIPWIDPVKKLAIEEEFARKKLDAFRAVLGQLKTSMPGAVSLYKEFKGETEKLNKAQTDVNESTKDGRQD